MAGEDRKFGKPEGLGERLAIWANSLGRNKSYPWAGLGLIDDIRAAARELGTDPDKVRPDKIHTHQAAREPAPKMEYDL